jgi:signal transduction histidine kinase
MKPRLEWNSRQATVGWIVGVAALGTILILIGLGPILGWRRSATSLVESRAGERAVLLALAFARDMRGVQETILAQTTPGDRVTLGSDFTDLVAGAFARYPYAESFFVSGATPNPEDLSFFNRTARPPAWMHDEGTSVPFPVVVVTNPLVGQQIAERIRLDAVIGRRFSAFDIRIGDVPYQIVARLSYRDAYRSELAAVFGFMTDLTWVRSHYFRDVAAQVSRIGDARSFEIRILDGRDKPIVGASDAADAGPVSRRSLPLLFFDPLLVAVDHPKDLTRENLTIEVSAAQDPGLRTANRAAVTTLALASAAGLALILGFSLTARAALASATLAQVRSEFVASMTHELRTPISTIRAIGNTLTSGRFVGPAVVPRYGQLLTNEAKRLGRLVDNVLAFSRITDVADVYSFDRLSVAEIVDDVLRDLATILSEQAFEVTVAIPPDIPVVRGDRFALRLLLDNLVDNAIRYSTTTRSISVSATVEHSMVVLSVSDKGVGIRAKELDQVTRRFFRGSGASAGGSGLGLAIVKKIVQDHDGVLKIESTEGEGTTVSVSLRTAHAVV